MLSVILQSLKEIDRYRDATQRKAAINAILAMFIKKTQDKVYKYVEKYGVLGLAVFIGIPLPGSGVYSGALGAYLLGFRFRDFMRGAVIGVLIAGMGNE